MDTDTGFVANLINFCTYQLPWVLIAFYVLRKIKMWDDRRQFHRKQRRARSPYGD